MSMKTKVKINKPALKRYKESLRYALYVMTHPFDGFWDLTHEKRGSMAAANTLLVLTFLTNIWNMRYENFMFNNVRWERVNIWSQIAGILAPLLLYVVANWCLTTLFDGKGRMKDVYMGMCYSLTPYILIMNPVTIISNVVTAEEGAFLTYFEYLALAWAFGLILVSVMQIHDYSLGKAILAILFSAVGMMIIVFLVMLFFSLVSDAVAFFVSVGKEIMFRVY
ncbi:MAG: YIP1 family protein [Lachnospiraceae bacterium]|nr:YIP1 family protein [Lachnospiraceae bacterium]